MTNSIETITVLVRGEAFSMAFAVTVEEFHPYEPAAYVTDPGWTCFDPATGVEYFVSQGTGSVFKQPENDEVGVAPFIKAAADKLEAEISKAMGEED